MTKLLVGRVSKTESKRKAAVKGKNTKPELLLRKLLRARGLRYRLHSRQLPGRPDIVFSMAKVAVFCDGDFWHGRKLVEQGQALSFQVRADYWHNKILRNVERDLRNTKELKKKGWRVVRAWETDIYRNGPAIADSIKSIVEKRLQKRVALENNNGRWSAKY